MAAVASETSGPVSDDDQQPAPEPAEDDDQQPATEPAEDDDQQPAPEPAEDDDQQPAPEPDEDEDDQPDGDTFPRSYVDRLRSRSAGYRTRAKDAEKRVAQLEHALFTERVSSLDVLADPTDMRFSAELLEDPDALADAVQELARQRPHYRKRGTTTGTGSRDRADSSTAVSLLGMMRDQ